MLRDFVESAIQQYLNDNGIAAALRVHIGPLTDHIVKSVEEGSVDLGEPNPVPEDNKAFGAEKKEESDGLVNGRRIYKAPSSSAITRTPPPTINNPRNPRNRNRVK